MKKTLSTLSFTLLLLCLLGSCNDEELKTEGELNAERISAIVEEKGLWLVTIYEWEIKSNLNSSQSHWKESVSEKDFIIESPFIRINIYDYYNLARLDKFRYEQDKLILYLK